MTRTVAAIATGLLALVACGTDDAVVPPNADAGAEPSRRLGSCADPVRLDGIDGATVSVSFDTTHGPPGRALLETGLACVAEAGDDVPQAVVAYRVPGVGRRTVRLTTDNEGTDPRFATMLVVREGSCDGPSPDPLSSGCFDTVQDGPRASGSVGADGGDTLYVVVTGNRFLVDAVGGAYAGRVRLDVTASIGSLPELRSSAVRLFSEEPAVVEIDVEGEDRDADAAGVVVAFLDASKAPVIWSPMGSGSVLGGPAATFLDPPETFEPFTRHVVLAPPPSEPVATAWVQLFDAAGGLSERLSVDVAHASWRSRGSPCDDVSLVCRRELECREDACQPSAPVAAACAAAETIVLDAPTEVTTSVSREGTLPASPGIFFPSCTDGSSAEALFRVQVPDGVAADLVVTESSESSGRLGLWVRGACDDSTSELACSIDRDAERRRFLDLREVAPGDHWVALDGFPFAGGDRHEESPYSLSIGLRPILPTGASCDPAGFENRCARGACPGGSARCP